MNSKVGILGGGISGLSAGFYLLQRFGKPFVIYEASQRVGGWIRTENHDDKGFRFESGPRTIRPKGIPGANTLELMETLNLNVKPISSKHVASRNRMIFAKGELCMLPNSLQSLFKTMPPFSKPLYKTLWHDICTGRFKIKNDDESIYSFVERRFGTELADYAISPMICGICAGDAKQISVRFLMNSIFEKEQKYGGVLRGLLMARFRGDVDETQVGLFRDSKPALYERANREKWAMYGLDQGLEQLPRTIKNYLNKHKVDIKTGMEVRAIKFNSNKVHLKISDSWLPFDHVISALPANKLGPLVKSQHPSLGAQLLSIPYVDVIVVNMQYAGRDLLEQPGFGLLVPPIEKLPILGIIFDSCCFDMQDNTILTVMMGGHWFDQHFSNRPTQKQILDVATEHVRKILKFKEGPKFSRVHVLHKCIPQYRVGHQRRIQAIRRYLKDYKLPISLCGAAYDGVGINDVILSARHQVDAMEMEVK